MLELDSGKRLSRPDTLAHGRYRQNQLTRITTLNCGVFVLPWGCLYDPPETIFLLKDIRGTMYSASVLLTTGMRLLWKKADTAGTLPLFAIFVEDADSLVVEVVVVINGASNIAAMVRSLIAHQLDSASGD